MDGDYELQDSDTKETFTSKELRQWFHEYRTLILTLNDFELGVVTVSLREYLLLPNTFLTARRIFKRQVLLAQKVQSGQ
jgi:hypothetical protein